jgi:YaiO family outer membrane protein
MMRNRAAGSATMSMAAAALLQCTLAQTTPSLAPRTEAEIGFTREPLTNSLPAWRSVYFEAEHRFADRHTLYGGVRKTERFGLDDTEVHSGLYFPLGATWTSLVEASVSPTHRVLPGTSLFGELHKRLPGGWGAGLALRHGEYNQTGTQIASLLVERYWDSFRGAYTLYSARPEGASSASSHRLQLSYYYGDRSSIGLSVSTGREVENVGPPRGVISSDVQNVTLTGRHWFAPGWALTHDLLTQQQGVLYHRQGLRLGIRHSF